MLHEGEQAEMPVKQRQTFRPALLHVEQFKQTYNPGNTPDVVGA